MTWPYRVRLPVYTQEQILAKRDAEAGDLVYVTDSLQPKVWVFHGSAWHGLAGAF